MIDDTPACSGDARFTEEDSDPEPLIEICRGCPLFDPCSSLADMDQPIPLWGIVGGRIRRRSKSTALMNPRAMERIVSG